MASSAVFPLDEFWKAWKSVVAHKSEHLTKLQESDWRCIICSYSNSISPFFRECEVSTAPITKWGIEPAVCREVSLNQSGSITIWKFSYLGQLISVPVNLNQNVFNILVEQESSFIRSAHDACAMEIPITPHVSTITW